VRKRRKARALQVGSLSGSIETRAKWVSHTFSRRAFLSRCARWAFMSSELAHSSLKNDGSEYLFKQAPAPATSNLYSKIGHQREDRCGPSMMKNFNATFSTNCGSPDQKSDRHNPKIIHVEQRPNTGHGK